ncbi:hypothetical protein ACI2L4_25255 [Streptomyces sparsogenes]|uniref:hypothetical protein n=1 Tax=Streptomyces sparsogenes TaxID=67365 RepID=UPI00384B2DD8
MAETTAIPAEQGDDWEDEETASAASYPEHPENPHNHIYTISMDSRGPMIVVRGNTPTEINERFQALLDSGTTTVAASVYSHIKAEMQVAQGVGPVSPAGPPTPPAPAPQGPPFGPNVSVPGAPSYQGPPAPAAPSAPQGGAPVSGARNGPKARPTNWGQTVYRIEVPIQEKDRFRAYRSEHQQYFKGKVLWAGGGSYWVHESVMQSFANYNPVPA